MIVDVRSREEYVKRHIKGAVNIPLFDLEYYIPFLRDEGDLIKRLADSAGKTFFVFATSS